MAISITRNNKIRSLTFMFAIKRKKDEKSINVITKCNVMLLPNILKWDINNRL